MLYKPPARWQDPHVLVLQLILLTGTNHDDDDPVVPQRL